MLIQGFSTFCQNHMQTLLADRHHHVWLKRIDRKAIGRGKRMLDKGRRYDAKYMITMPRDHNGDH